MSKQVFINLPVSDLSRATAFYEAVGFTKNMTFSDEHASSMMWSDEIIFMLLNKDFYAKFLRDRSIADTQTTNATLIALTVDSKEAVQQFADSAKANGGDYFKVDMGVSEDMMFGYEVLDPDGNQIEPVWMNADFIPESPTETL